MYKDSLFFVCLLAIAKWKYTRHNCNPKTKLLFRDYCQHFQVDSQYLKVLELTDFPQLYEYYETELFVIVSKEYGTVTTVYFSQALFPIKIYMNSKEIN